VLTPDDVRSIPLFSMLSVAELERLAETSADLQLAAGEFAVHEGGDRALYAVLTGRIEVVKLSDASRPQWARAAWRLPSSTSSCNTTAWSEVGTSR
jgi:thioredoxin reductase (NADPH)